jgi:hypothetical protein
VAEGRAESLSAWVNGALRRQADHDRRMKALDEFLDGYEAEHGAITEQEIEAATRRARTRAVVVRTPVREKDPAPPESHDGCRVTIVLDAGAFVAVERATGISSQSSSGNGSPTGRP